MEMVLQRSYCVIIFEREENTCPTLLLLKKVPVLGLIQKLRVNQAAAFGGSLRRHGVRNSLYEVARAAVQWFQKVTLQLKAIERTEMVMQSVT